jgi:hypothetical protein
MRVNYSKTTYHNGHPSYLHTSKDPQPQRTAASQKHVIDEEDNTSQTVSNHYWWRSLLLDKVEQSVQDQISGIYRCAIKDV